MTQDSEPLGEEAGRKEVGRGLRRCGAEKEMGERAGGGGRKGHSRTTMCVPQAQES